MVYWSCQACLCIHVWIPACAGMTRGEIYVVSKYVLYRSISKNDYSISTKNCSMADAQDPSDCGV